MSNEDLEVGSVDVHVRPKAVLKAVRNILANEMKLDPEQVRQEVHTKADALIEKTVLEYLSKTGYTTAQLEMRVQRAVEARLVRIDELLAKAVREVVMGKINDQVVRVIEVLVTKGLEVQLGWHRDMRVKITTKEQE